MKKWENESGWRLEVKKWENERVSGLEKRDKKWKI